MPGTQLTKIQQTLENDYLQSAIYTSTGRLMGKRKAVVGDDVLPEYQELRTQANGIKKHTIENLDYYLEQMEAKVAEYGGKVIATVVNIHQRNFVFNGESPVCL